MKGSIFTSHWLRVRIDGFRPEKLLTETMKKGAAFRSITYRDETEAYLTVDRQGYRLLKKMAKSRYRITIIKEGGTAVVIKKFRMNRMLTVGLVLFVLFYLVQSAFVKEINIIGCDTITEDSIRKVLREEGLYEGCLKTFDCDKIEKRLFQEYDHIVWAKVAYQGKYVQVEISEGEKEKGRLIDRERPCHLVAEQDCYIEKVYTYKGSGHVKEGDFVTKGGVLISGIVPIEHPSYPIEEEESAVHYVHAEGKVIARIPYYFSFYVEPDSTEAEIEAQIRQWIQKNVPETAEILNKDFQFEAKKNIIKVYGIIETRQQVGVEKEIVIDNRQNTGNEENSD